MKYKSEDIFKFLARKYVAIPFIIIMVFGFVFGGLILAVQILGMIDTCLLDQVILENLNLDVTCDDKFLENNILITIAYSFVSWMGFWQAKLFYKGMKKGIFTI